MNATNVIGQVVENRVWFATLTPPAANDLLFVSTYESEDNLSNAINHHGYQRPPMQKRFSEIAKYFTTGNNATLVTPIIVSVRLKKPENIERFLKLLAAGDIAGIREEFGDQIASIVDGQHRFYGMLTAWEADPDFLPPIPMMLYFGLSYIEEAELFNIVNVTQRKLPKALIETTRGDITETDQVSYAQEIRRLTFSLCRDEDSVWGPVAGVEQINMTGVRDPNRTVTYEGLRRSTSNMFPKELLDRLSALDEGLPIAFAKRFWDGVAENCREAWDGVPDSRLEIDPITGDEHEVRIKYRIKDLVGVSSLAKLGKDIVLSQLESPQNDKLDQLVGKLIEVDWEKNPENPWMRSQAGFAGQKEMYLMLHRLVYSDVKPGVIELADTDDQEGAVA